MESPSPDRPSEAASSDRGRSALLTESEPSPPTLAPPPRSAARDTEVPEATSPSEACPPTTGTTAEEDAVVVDPWRELPEVARLIAQEHQVSVLDTRDRDLRAALAVQRSALSGMLGWHAVECLAGARMMQAQARQMLVDEKSGRLKVCKASELNAAASALKTAALLRRLCIEGMDDSRAQWSAEKGAGGEGKETTEPKVIDNKVIDKAIEEPGDDHRGHTFLERRLMRRLAPIGQMEAQRIAPEPPPTEESRVATIVEIPDKPAGPLLPPEREPAAW